MSEQLYSIRLLRACLSIVLAGALVCGCTTIPGANYPKQASSALAQPEITTLGRQSGTQAHKHPDTSGFRLLPSGIEGLQMRLDLAAVVNDAAPAVFRYSERHDGSC